MIGDYLHRATDTVPVIGSVCTGALVLAAAGLLDRDIYEPMLGPMVQQQLANRPELLARLSG